MQFELEWRPEVGKKVESFFGSSGYREYLDSAVSFNRKLNEERKMRLPYIDGQTGIAQRHYNHQRLKRERMPGTKPGQIYSYPQRHWKKKKYQYLRYFMYEKRMEALQMEQQAALQMEMNAAAGIAVLGNVPPNDDSNNSGANVKEDMSKEWSYYEDMFPENDDADYNSDSDFEYEDYSKKKSKSGKKSAKKGDSRRNTGTGGGSSGAMKRRSHSDHIPDSEKPFHCEFCGIRYKTRPGLSYHIKTSHKDKDISHLNLQPSPIGGGTASVQPDEFNEDSQNSLPIQPPNVSTPQRGIPPPYSVEQHMQSPGFNNSPQQQGRVSARRGGQPNYNEDSPFERDDHPRHMPHERERPRKVIGPDGKERVISLGYCDFCLGDASDNKKTNQPEELVSCAECGRSGHPTCLQFTDNMLISVKKYSWQCIECKCCSICGTAENDDQLLFCDDCDRGYHMYCLVPKIKEPPEGSWSCKLCIETFHTRNNWG